MTKKRLEATYSAPPDAEEKAQIAWQVYRALSPQAKVEADRLISQLETIDGVGEVTAVEILTKTMFILPRG